MAASQKLVDFTFSTDATFRAFAQAHHDAFVAIGLTQTSDTGQIDLSTATYPGSVSTSGGYEIWRFNDAEQGTTPIFFKIEYYRGTATSTNHTRITTGTGSNGSGTLTNAGTQRTILQNSGSSAVVAARISLAYDSAAGVLTYLMDNQPEDFGGGTTNAGGPECGWIIERIRNRTTKAYVAGEWTFMWSGTSNNPGMSYEGRVSGGGTNTVVNLFYYGDSLPLDSARVTAGRKLMIPNGIWLPKAIRAPLRGIFSINTVAAIHGLRRGQLARLAADDGVLRDYMVFAGGSTGTAKGVFLHQ